MSDACIFCHGNGMIEDQYCAQCAGKGVRRENYSAGQNYGKVNDILKYGIPKRRRHEFVEAVHENRWRAGLWLYRLWKPDLGEIAALNDAVMETRVADAKEILAEIMAMNPHPGPSFPPSQLSQQQWKTIVDQWALVNVSYDDVQLRRENYSVLRDFWEVVDLSMVDYRLKCTASRATRRWQVREEFTSSPSSQKWVRCTFCRAALRVADKNNGYDYTMPTNPHTLLCGLYLMAFDERVSKTQMAVIR